MNQITVTVNGKTKTLTAPEGQNISVINGRILVDGKDYTDECELPENVVKIEVKGTLLNLETDATVNCENVEGNVVARGSVNCDRVAGNVQAGGSVNCDNVNGDVVAGGSVNCNNIRGTIR